MLSEQRAYVSGGSMPSMPPAIVPEYIVPEYVQEKQAEPQLLPRTIYEITLTGGKSPSSSTTILCPPSPGCTFPTNPKPP